MFNFLKNWKESLKHIPYTWKHYKCVLWLQDEIFKNHQQHEDLYVIKMMYKNNIRFEYPFCFHDLDKIFMYIFLGFLGTRKIKELHRYLNKHHIKGDETDFRSLLEALIDWESAHYTKEDKPYNAAYFIANKQRVEEQLIELNKIINDFSVLFSEIKTTPFTYN